jgi:hypothetical protein
VAVYCDTPRWTRNDELSGHLIGVPLEALHEIAVKIGLSPFRYFHPQATVPHYELPARLRAEAIAAGAQPLEPDEFRRALERVHASLDQRAPTARSTPPPADVAQSEVNPTQTRTQGDLFAR